MARIGFNKKQFGDRVKAGMESGSGPIAMPTLGNQQPIQWPEMQGPIQQPTLGNQQPIAGPVPDIFSAQGPMPQQPQLGNQQPIQRPTLGNQQPIGMNDAVKAGVANDLNQMSAYGAPAPVQPQQGAPTPWNQFDNGMQTTQLPNQGQVRAPIGVAEAVEAQRAQPQTQGYQSQFGAPEGYTEQEKRQFDQQTQIAGAKKGIGERIAAKELAKSLESQGLSRDEINKAIGGNTAETLSNLKAIQSGRTASSTGKGIDARARESAVQGARYEEDGTTPKNIEARAVGYMDWADSVGSNPEGKSNYDAMSKGERNQYDRAVKSMSRGTKNPNAERSLKGMMDRVDKKRERAFNKQQSELLNETAQIAIDKAQGDKEKAYYGKLKSQSEILMKEYQGKSSSDRKKEITAELGQINEAFKADYQEPFSMDNVDKAKYDANGRAIQYLMKDGSIVDAPDQGIA